MPELPDLTVFSANLASKLNGQTVKSVEAFNDKRLNVTAAALQDALVGASLKDVQREGKELLFQFSNDSSLLIHLMLSGGFTITETPDPIKFKALTISFENGTTLVASDPKGLLSVKLNHPPSKVPDALDIDVDYLRGKIAKKLKMVAKAFLIDQSIVRGIGNAYADEILWEARISPKSIMGKIPDDRIEALFNSMRTVLIDAVDQIRKINPDIISGEVRDFLKVHNSRRRQCPNGRPIIREQIASKTTYYTDEQVLYT
jgi:formamidopyrimidine-DNA glycosylase